MTYVKPWNCDGDVTSPGNHEYISIGGIQVELPNLYATEGGRSVQSPDQSQGLEPLGPGQIYLSTSVCYMKKLK